jgi:hypothetical protein
MGKNDYPPASAPSRGAIPEEGHVEHCGNREGFAAHKPREVAPTGPDAQLMDETYEHYRQRREPAKESGPCGYCGVERRPK